MLWIVINYAKSGQLKSLNHRKSCDLYGWHALKGQKLLAQGNALGLSCSQNLSPCKGKSFKTPGAICKAFALTGRIANCPYTQGAALG